MSGGADDRRRKIRRLWGAHFLALEALLAVAAAIALAAYGELADANGIDHFLKDHKSALYTVMASIDGALLGFVITTTSIILTFASSDRMTIVRESPHYQTLWDTFVQTMVVLAVATIASVVALVAGGEPFVQRIVFYVWTLVSLLAVARLARCIWILRHVVTIVTSAKGRAGGE